jgi:glycosyltransferase involved in cell wall biosynthesis
MSQELVAITACFKSDIPKAKALEFSFKKYHRDVAFKIISIDPQSNELINYSDKLDLDCAADLLMLYEPQHVPKIIAPFLIEQFLSTYDTVWYFSPDIIFQRVLPETLNNSYELALYPTGLNAPIIELICNQGISLLDPNVILAKSTALKSINFLQHQLLNHFDAEGSIDNYLASLEYIIGLADVSIIKDQYQNVSIYRAIECDLDQTQLNINSAVFLNFEVSLHDERLKHLIPKNGQVSAQFLAVKNDYLERIKGTETNYHYQHIQSDHVSRIFYRQLYAKYLKGNGFNPPNPLKPQERSDFYSIFNEQYGHHKVISVRKKSRSKYSRNMSAINKELNSSSGDYLFDDSNQNKHTLNRFFQGGQNGRLLTPIKQFELHSAKRIPGINFIGYLKAQVGKGQEARNMINGIKAAGIPYAAGSLLIGNRSNDAQFDDWGTNSLDYNLNLFCINADHLQSVLNMLGADYLKNRYNVGIWAWETEEFPDYNRSLFEVLNEVWAVSVFAAESIKKKSPIPVYPIPMQITLPDATDLVDLQNYGLDLDVPYFLFIFDYFSIFERKNPQGLIDAFLGAFNDRGPALVIKCINSDYDYLNHQQVVKKIRGTKTLHLIEDTLTDAQMHYLLKNAFAYVSLHRSEGFGLTMAEAMSLGVPTIATAYSGNMDFMSEDNSLLVPYELTEIPPGCFPYKQGSKWAEPDINQAAHLIKLVYENPVLRQNLSEKAASDLNNPIKKEKLAKFISMRFLEIQNMMRT